MKRKDKILNDISRVARRLFGNGNGGYVYLYGSQARADANANSDWDLIIITDDSPVYDDNEAFIRYAFPFAEIGWHYGAQITPIHFTRSQWDAQRGTAFFINVTSEAIRL